MSLTILETLLEKSATLNKVNAYRCDPYRVINVPETPMPEFETVTIEENNKIIGFRLDFPNIEEFRGQATVGTSIASPSYFIPLDSSVNILHDFTFDFLTIGGDREFQEIFGFRVNSDDTKTPDIYKRHDDEIVILEATTTKSDNVKTLETAFNVKKCKYEDMIEIRTRQMNLNKYDEDVINVRFEIIALSSRSLLTNCIYMTEEIAEELCFRYRLIKRIIRDKLGPDYGIQEEEDRELSKEMKQLMLQFKTEDLDFEGEEYFTKSLYDKVMLGEPDTEYVKTVLTKEFKLSIEESLDTAIKPLPECKESAKKLIKEYMEKINDKPSNEVRSLDDQKPIINLPFLVCYEGEATSDLKNESDDNTCRMDPNIESINTTSAMIKQAIFLVNTNQVQENEENISAELEQALRAPHRETKDEEIERKLLRRKYRRMKLDLDAEMRLDLAKDGVQAKKMLNNIEVTEKRKYQKKSFSFEHRTQDIEDFLREDNCLFDEIYAPQLNEEELESMENAMTINQCDFSEDISLEYQRYHQLGLASISRIYSQIAIELTLSLKQNVNLDEFIIKKIRNYDIFLLIKPTNMSEKIFFSIFCKQDIFQIDPNIYKGTFREMKKSGEYYFTEFVSLNKSKLVNIVKAEASMMSYYYFFHEMYSLIPWEERENSFSYKEVKVMTLNTFLIHLHDKSCVEEIITDTRYLFMEGFVIFPAKPNPQKMIERLPKFFKSRLQLHYCKSFLWAIETLMNQGGFKPSNKDNIITWEGLFNFFTKNPLDNPYQLINTFYIGYCKNKEEIPEKNSSISLLTKILALEDQLPGSQYLGEGDPEDPKKHEFSFSLLIEAINTVKMHFNEIKGSGWEQDLEDSVLREMSYYDLEKLATLKASSLYNREDYRIKTFLESKHPRSKMIIEVAKNMQEGKTTLAQCFLTSMNYIKRQNCLHVDIFRKPQHGGLREIYVLGYNERVIQLVLEIMGRKICHLFDSETMTHPKSKTGILTLHKRKVKELGGLTYTTSTAEDKSKWNQGHFVTKFAIMLYKFMPEYMHGFINNALKMWTRKRIRIDENILRMIVNNHCLNFADSFNQEIVDVLWDKKTANWYKGDSYIETKTGMMQGILHYTSSAFHSIYLTFMKILIEKYSNSHFREKMIVDFLVSSDDSAVLMSSSFTNEESIRKVQILHYAYSLFIEKMCKYFGMYPSIKSTKNLYCVHEFNSEFTFFDNTYKPSFRWVSALLLISEQESIANRQEELSNLLTNVLESGVSFSTCSFLQLSQMKLHYLLLGSYTLGVFKNYIEKLLTAPDPAHGYFMLDHPFVAGLCGFRFNLWRLVKNSNLGNKYSAILKDQEILSNMAREANTKVKILQTTNSGTLVHCTLISWGGLSKYYSIVEKLGLPDNWLEVTDQNPELLYMRAKTSDQLKIKLAQKMSSPGVMSSLSKGNSLVKVLASSAYVIRDNILIVKDPLLSKEENSMKMKSSLLREVMDDIINREDGANIGISERDLALLFPDNDDYKVILSAISRYNKPKGIRYSLRPRKTTTRLELTEVTNPCIFSPDRLVAHKWFGIGKIAASTDVVNRLWRRLKDQVTWLFDDPIMTLNSSPFDHQVQIQNFLARLDRKGRSVLLSGTPLRARQGKGNLLTAIKHDFFPNFILNEDSIDHIVRSNVESASNMMSTLYLSLNAPVHWKVKHDIVEEVLVMSQKIGGETGFVAQGRKGKIKIIQEWLKGELDKDQLLDKIYEHKMGIVGSFTQRQELVSIPGTNRKQHIGSGQWVGRMGSISCRIFSEYSKVTKRTHLLRIEVKKEPDWNEFYMLLKQFCEEASMSSSLISSEIKKTIEFNREMDNKENIESPFKFCKDFMRSPRIEEAIPIYIRNFEDKMSSQGIDRVSISVTNDKIRLMAEIDDKLEPRYKPAYTPKKGRIADKNRINDIRFRTLKYVILSVKIDSRDYNFNFQDENSYTENRIISDFVSNRETDAKELMMELYRLNKEYECDDNSKTKTNNQTFYNYEELRGIVRETFLNHYKSKGVSLTKYEKMPIRQRMIFNADTWNEINNIDGIVKAFSSTMVLMEGEFAKVESYEEPEILEDEFFEQDDGVFNKIALMFGDKDEEIDNKRMIYLYHPWIRGDLSLLSNDFTNKEIEQLLHNNMIIKRLEPFRERLALLLNISSNNIKVVDNYDDHNNKRSGFLADFKWSEMCDSSD